MVTLESEVVPEAEEAVVAAVQEVSMYWELALEDLIHRPHSPS